MTLVCTFGETEKTEVLSHCWKADFCKDTLQLSTSSHRRFGRYQTQMEVGLIAPFQINDISKNGFASPKL